MSIEFVNHAQIQCPLNGLYWHFKESQKNSKGDLSIKTLSAYQGFEKPLVVEFSRGDDVEILTEESIGYAKVKEIILKRESLFNFSTLRDEDLTVTIDWYYPHSVVQALKNSKVTIELFNGKVRKSDVYLTNHSQVLSVSTINSKAKKLQVAGYVTFPIIKKRKQMS